MKKNGFTLAEVLITLGIIGVVASMTIPILIHNVFDQELRGQYKKVYSTVNQAVMGLVSDNGGSLSGLFTDADTEASLLASKMQIVSICNSVTSPSGCYFQGLSTNLHAVIVLKDGSMLGANSLDTNCNTTWGPNNFGQYLCGELYIDVNGNQKPNTPGKDVFWVGLTPNKVIPAGSDGILNATYRCPDGVYCNSFKYLYN